MQRECLFSDNHRRPAVREFARPTPPASATPFRWMQCECYFRSIRWSGAVPTHDPAMLMGPTRVGRCGSIRHTSHRSSDLVSPRAPWRAGKTCCPWFLAAWRIHNQIVDDHGGFWTRVARYHSATPRYVATYRRQLLEYAPRWRAWLVAHYPTVVSAPGFHSAVTPTRDVSREMPSGASHAESPPLATPRRTTAPVGLQALRGAGAPLNRDPVARASFGDVEQGGCQSVAKCMQVSDYREAERPAKPSTPVRFRP